MIPTGYSLVTHFVEMPFPGGTRTSSTSYGVAIPPTDEDAGALHSLYGTLIHNPLANIACALTGTVMRDELTAFEGTTVVYGANTNTLTSPNVSVLVRKRTGLLGRKNQGRMFPPGMSYENTWNSSGQMEIASQEDYDEAFNDWRVAVEGLGGDMVILHTDETTPTPIVNLSTDLTAATQRRRLR